MTKAVELAQIASTGVSEAFKNRIINGAMVIDQRNNGSSVTVTAGSPAIYPVDRTFINRTNGYNNNATAQRVTDAPAGFVYSLKYTAGTAETPTGGMYSNIQHFIEGFNIADLGWGTSDAKAVTLSFWVKLSITGTFGFNLRSTNAGWSYASTFTYSSANTWQFVSTTIPGPTIGGTDVFTNDNGLGVGIFWDLGVGSNLTTSTLNSWQAVNILGVTGTTKLNATTGATYQITGVQMEVGSTATSFEYRPYGTELQLCYRYYFTSRNKLGGGGGDAAYSGWSGYTDDAYTHICSGFTFPVDMRAAPTMTIFSSANGYVDGFGRGQYGGGFAGCTSDSIMTYCVNYVSARAGGGSNNFATGSIMRGGYIASAEL
jgi:hypothetical protein